MLGRICCLVLPEGMVRSLLSRLLHPHSRTRGTWNRKDPYVMCLRDLEFVDIGPAFALKRHSRCCMTGESLDQLGLMIEDAGYRCCRDQDDNNISHVSGWTQHKFDGVHVVFGAQHHGMWERALCPYDRQSTALRTADFGMV